MSLGDSRTFTAISVKNATSREATMKRKSRIVAVAALFTLAGVALSSDPTAAADRRDGSTPQQGVANAQPGPVDAQAKYQVDYHADYRAKGSPGESASGDESRRDARRDRGWDRDRDRRSPLVLDPLGRIPGAWPR